MQDNRTIVFLSIDSAIAATHNKIRGISCLSTIESALRNIGLPLNIVVNTVLSRLNCDKLTSLPKWMKKHGLHLINPIPMKDSRLSLTEENLIRSLCSLLEACVTLNIGVYVEGVGECSISPQHALELLREKPPTVCATGGSTLFIETDGSCYPCNSSSRRLPKLCYGNAFETGVVKVWQSWNAKTIRSALSRSMPIDCKGFCDFCNVLRNKRQEY